MPQKAASAAGARKAPAAHVLAEEFPSGILLKDLCKREWRLGKVLGKGGFGLIYLASEAGSKSENYVIKIEPKGNGPLFCETHFYHKVAKSEYIQEFITSHNLKYLGVPPFVGTGLENYKSCEYRFLVMPRFGADLQKLLQKNGGVFTPCTTFAVALRMVDALQFLHEKEYVHADIKAANILLGFSKGKEVPNEVYLVDYGLTYRYTVGNQHKEYKEDPKKAHDGTIEFTSRDAHKGLAPSRRGDLEILGYCMLQWLSGHLPWENKLANANSVAELKESFMGNLQAQLAKCFPKNQQISDCMYHYFDHVKKLQYHSEPNYSLLRKILGTTLAKLGQRNEWIIDFSLKGEKRSHADSDSADESSLRSKKKSPRLQSKSPRGRQSPRGMQSPETSSSSSSTPKIKKNPRLISKSPRGKQSPKGRPSPQISSPSSSRPGQSSAKRPTAKSSVSKFKNSNNCNSATSQTSLPHLAAHKSSLKHTSISKVATNGNKPKKFFKMPASTKPTSPKVTNTPQRNAVSKAPTRRVARRVAVAHSDTSAQTSPGLVFNN